MINREDIVSEMYDYYHIEDKKQSKKFTSLRENKKRIINKNKLLNESKGKLNKSKVIDKPNKSLKESIKDDFDFLDKMTKAAGTDIKEGVDEPTESGISFKANDLDKVKKILHELELDRVGYKKYVDLDETPNSYGICHIWFNLTNKDRAFSERVESALQKIEYLSKGSLKESVVKSTEEYIEDALKEKGIPFDYNLDEDGYFVYQFKNEEDLQQADMIICDIVGDQYESNHKKLKIWLTNDLAESKILKEDLSFFEKELGSNWRNIELKDDVNSTEGGIAHEGETLGEFIDEVGTKHIKSLEDLNDALRVCGISPVERIEESLNEGLTLEESIKQSEDAVYESYLEGMRRYSKDDRLAKSYASCMHNFDISRLNELVNKKNGEKND